MKAIKKLLMLFVFLTGLISSNAANAGIPVIDVANLAQAVEQVLAWQQQYEQMVQTIQQEQQQFNALTGSRNLGDILNNPALQSVIPADIQATYQGIQSGGYNGLSGAAKAIRQAGGMVYNCEDQNAANKTACEALYNTNAQTMATQQSALTLVQQRMNQIDSIRSQINSTSDPKAIAELQARLQAENAQVSNDANKIAIMNAMAQSQQAAAEQAVKEKQMKLLSTTKAPVASSFTFQIPQ